ncbi:MAG TPA: DUF5996 family protein [Gammaproteobacteria bacterium]|nr:DUF5996 family protein [Gammaproteobacteria bacterium]
MTSVPEWPEIPYPPWRETCTALHLFAQIVGKYRLARTPWVNHSWHATFYVHARGLTTARVPDVSGDIEIRFDLIDHVVVGENTNGRTEAFDLGPMSVAQFHSRFLDLIRALGGTPKFHGRPSETRNPVPFVDDVAGRPYDSDAVTRFFRALAVVARVFERFRTAYIGKVSPVHLFWGSFDLAVTRFSGRRAPLHPGQIPNLPDDVTREAYSHEVSSAGFWAGGPGVEYPAFYSYAYPAPPGFAEARLEPAAAFFEKTLGEFLLPYDAVRLAENPEASLLGFLESAYAAAATLGQWDRSALECELGRPGRPRAL